MEPMTPEERFTKIENFLNAVSEHQAQHAEQMSRNAQQIAELAEIQKVMAVAINRVAEAQLTSGQRFDEKMTAVDEDMDAVKEALRATAEQQRITEEKLHALIDTVDRIIRNQKN